MVSADHASYYNEITVFSEMAELCGSSPEHGPANVEQSCRHEDGAFLGTGDEGLALLTLVCTSKFQWGLVLAGISDFARPAESLSLTQNAALTATGAIWTRWCFIIKPRNLFLAAVNFFLGCVGITQVTRILLYQQSLKNATPAQVAEAHAVDAKETAKDIVENPAAAANKAVR